MVYRYNINNFQNHIWSLDVSTAFPFTFYSVFLYPQILSWSPKIEVSLYVLYIRGIENKKIKQIYP